MALDFYRLLTGYLVFFSGSQATNKIHARKIKRHKRSHFFFLSLIKYSFAEQDLILKLVILYKKK